MGRGVRVGPMVAVLVMVGVSDGGSVFVGVHTGGSVLAVTGEAGVSLGVSPCEGDCFVGEGVGDVHVVAKRDKSTVESHMFFVMYNLIT